jgi:hypothetical protein
MALVDILKRQRFRQREARLFRERDRIDRSSQQNRTGLADLDGVEPAFHIPASKGFARVEALDSELLAECVEDTQQRFREERARNQQLNKKPYFVELTGIADYSADSAPFRLATSPGVVRAVADYLGSVPQLHNITSVFSPSSEETIAAGQQGWTGSQLFHRDGEDRRLVKLWVLCSDVTMEHGPTMVLPADLSNKMAVRLRYAPGTKLPDDPFRDEWSNLEAATGPVGTVYATDTASCFHFGSRTQRESSRLVLMLHYMTHHSSSFHSTSESRSKGEGLGTDLGSLSPATRRLLGVY